MHEEDVGSLARRIAACLCGHHEHLCLTLIACLAEGQPVPLASLARAAGSDRETVREALQEIPDIEWDEAGNIVAFGLSLLPTVHQFAVNGQSLYTWCALDTFMYTALLAQPVQVTSQCPVSGRSILLTMTPAGITQAEPAESMLSLVIPSSSVVDCRRSAFCNYGHFFATADAGLSWQRTHPDALLLPLTTAHLLGQLLVDQRKRHACA